MPIVYAPDGTPYEIPDGEVPGFVRQGYLTTKPEASVAATPPQMDTTKTGGVGQSKEVNTSDGPRQATDLTPALKEEDGSWTNTYEGQQINVNTASLKELTTLPGVGTAIARKVVENRPYKSAEDLIAKVEILSGDWLSIATKLTF